VATEAMKRTSWTDVGFFIVAVLKCVFLLAVLELPEK
jgi:hypothetical protein